MKCLVSILFLVVFFSKILSASQTSLPQEPLKDLNAVSAQTSEAASNEQVKNDSGSLIYENHCIVCHRDGLMGAPKLKNEKDWNPRLVKRTLDDLLASSIKGINAMPARGTCPECSDADLRAAIEFMLPQP